MIELPPLLNMNKYVAKVNQLPMPTRMQMFTVVKRYEFHPDKRVPLWRRILNWITTKKRTTYIVTYVIYFAAGLAYICYVLIDKKG